MNDLNSASFGPNSAILLELAATVGEEVVPELLRAFVSDLERSREKASAAVAAGDAEALKSTLHSLCGYCSYFGAETLRALATSYRSEALTGAGELDAAWVKLETAILATIRATTEIMDAQ